MARKQTFEVAQQEGIERLVVLAVSRVGVLIPPWLVLILELIVAAISHHVWGGPPAVTWTTMAGTLSTTILTALTWAVSHQRSPLGRWHSTLTAAGAGMWFVIANITGVTNSVTAALWFFGGGTLALGWNIRAVIRQTPSESGHGDVLGWIFDRSKNAAGLDGGRIRTRETTEHKIQAELDVPDGKTVDDVQKKMPVLEAAAEVPVGTFSVTPNIDNAGKAHVIVTDPRTMRQPIPWPGPSRPGGSVSEPLRPGLFQDMDPVEHVLPGHHLQLMGMSGAGKSIGGCWNYHAELITRIDVAVLAADISKGEQTLGPLRPALHRFETTKAGARALLHDVRGEIKNRTDWLAERGYQKWVPGCGLSYWVIWWEEFPDIYDTWNDKDEETFKSAIRAIRSAGGSMALSLQRSDFTQMPTFARGQLAKMCFGVADDHEASFGLSDRQKSAGACPELWQNFPEHQGKAYLDAPSIPDERLAIPLRTWAWGEDDQESQANIAAHAEQWPAAAKTIDEFTRRISAETGSAARPSPAIPMPAAVTAAAETHRPVATLTLPREEAEPAEVDQDFEMLVAAAELVIHTRHASTQMLQRKLRLANADCLRIMEALERKKIVGPQPADGYREVLVAAEGIDDVLEGLRADGDAVIEYSRTPDPDPEITAGPNDEIPEPTPMENRLRTPGGPTQKMSPAAAQRLVEDWIRHRAGIGELSFTASDDELQAIRQKAGMTSRTWVHGVLNRLAGRGVLDRDESGTSTVFRVADLDRLDRGEAS